MSPLVFSAVLVLLAFALIFLLGVALASDNEAFVLVGIVSAVFALVCVVLAITLPAVIYSSRHFGRVSCDNFAIQSGYQTKFVLLNSWATGTCLAHTKDGRWVPTNQLIGVSRG
jgi:hypothetical protein